MSVDVVRDRYVCPADYNLPEPFDIDDVVDTLRLERYVKAESSPGSVCGALKRLYYAVRPLMGVGIRKHLQRAYLKGWQNITFPGWPVDRTVECIVESVVRLAVQLQDGTEMPFVWFWPDGASGCLILTHDIETATGRDFAPRLAGIDASFGFTPSFQVVPEERYEIDDSLLSDLRSRGCEINIHGLNHDGRLFESRQTFLDRAARINSYARKYDAAGFRSPVLYRNLEWYKRLQFSYDMSVPNCAHLDPQRGGCCTVMPYFIGNMVELPLTMTQDYSLFHYLKQDSIDLWKQQIDLVLEKNGLISFNVHPDYIIGEPYRSLYCELLEHLATVCEERNIWAALPNEVNRWWRRRRESIATNACARVDKDCLVYEAADLQDALLRSAA